MAMGSPEKLDQLKRKGIKSRSYEVGAGACGVQQLSGSS